MSTSERPRERWAKYYDHHNTKEKETFKVVTISRYDIYGQFPADDRYISFDTWLLFEDDISFGIRRYISRRKMLPGKTTPGFQGATVVVEANVDVKYVTFHS